ncbi:ATP-binding protein [Acetobacteraceae bacterium]|nr:ATP-binding protein [Acetobacteraceae bacterium]
MSLSPSPEKKIKIRPRDKDALLQSLRAGVVPRIGQHLIQVGRKLEVETLIKDIERLSDGGSAFRLIVGEYGAGKTFFLNLVRTIALEHKLVVASADLNPDRRLHATGGQARSLFAELMRNLSTRARPDGNAMAGIVEKFIATCRNEAKAEGKAVETILQGKLEQLSELVNGYDFAEVISAYCRGFEEDNQTLKNDALRWLRGEFSTKTDAKKALSVRAIVEDGSFYDQLKLMALFVRLAGYNGLLISLDEMVNLFKLSNAQARRSNYEQLLRILNDSLQGTAVGLGFILGGTPEFLLDPRRGLYSYEALQSRLAQNNFATDGLVDFSGPVVRLSSLTPEDFYLLLSNIRNVHASGDESKYLIPDEAIKAFMQHCNERIGNSFFRTPRTTITAFINLLAVLEQNPNAKWQDLVGGLDIQADQEAHILGENTPTADEDEFADFTL